MRSFTRTLFRCNLVVLLIPWVFASTPRQQSSPITAAAQAPAKTPEENPATGKSLSEGAPPVTANSAVEQRQLLADSQRLFQLSADLKLELVKAPPGALSIDVIKKAAEVEKLARSLSQRMKD